MPDGTLKGMPSIIRNAYGMTYVADIPLDISNNPKVKLFEGFLEKMLNGIPCNNTSLPKQVTCRY